MLACTQTYLKINVHLIYFVHVFSDPTALKSSQKSVSLAAQSFLA